MALQQAGRRLGVLILGVAGVLFVLGGGARVVSADHGPNAGGNAAAVRACRDEQGLTGRALGQCVRDHARDQHDGEDGRVRLIDRAAIAAFLGISAQELRAELDGRSLAQVAQRHGVSRAQLRQFLVDRAQQAIAAAQAGGRIMPARAAELQQRLLGRVDEAIDRVHEGRGQGRGGDKDGKRGRGPR